MTGRYWNRRRSLAALGLTLTAGASLLAQMPQVLPPAQAVLPAIPIPAASEPNLPASPVQACLPPLVLTPPSPPQVLTAPAPTTTSVREAAKPPVRETAPAPSREAPAATMPRVVSATPASISKVPARPAIAEIVAAGPKSVDVSSSFQAALAESRAGLAKLRDFSGHVILQERQRGELQPEQTAEIRGRTAPRAIALKFIAPTSMVGRELVFAEGRNANKARVKASGTFGPLAFASLPVSDAKAAVTGSLTLHDVSLSAILERVERILATEAKLRNPVQISAADYTFAGKTVTRYEIVCERSHALRDAAKVVLCIDPDTKLPVRFEAHDDKLREAISFVNLSLNQGVGDSAFER